MGYEFMGFHRPDGRVGARNLVGVIPSVTCANDVAQAIVTEVQGTVGYFHHQGCCQLPAGKPASRAPTVTLSWEGAAKGSPCTWSMFRVYRPKDQLPARDL